ncbi:hypothetical protein Gotur_029029, partial [Gossypium turneri]
MTPEAAEIMEKLKDKKAKYEAIASSDSSVHLEDIDNRIITEVLGPERYGQVRFQEYFGNPTQYFGSSSHQYMPSESQAQAEVQRLKNQIAEMQATTVEVQRKYEELQLQLKAEAAAREAEAAARKAEGCSEGSRAKQKVRRTPAAASEYDEDVPPVPSSAV